MRMTILDARRFVHPIQLVWQRLDCEAPVDDNCLARDVAAVGGKECHHSRDVRWGGKAP